MKKKILTLLSFIFLSFSMLSGCGGFIEDEALVISSINTQILDDGRTMVVITYTDDEIAPVIFYIPKGSKGDIGLTGNGIKSITHSDPDENGVITITIEFTDINIEPVELEIKNGVSIKEIEEVKDENDNNIGFIVHYTDGTSSKQISIPAGKDGADGVGISSYIQNINEDGSSEIIFEFTDGEIFTCKIEAPQKGDTGRGIDSIVSSEDDEFYYLYVFYNDGSVDEIMFNKPASPIEWSSGRGRPNVSDGKDGDFYFDTEYKTIYRKTDGNWIVVVVFEDTYEVKFDLNADDAYFPDGFGFTYEYYIKGGHSFYSSNKQVPIPVRAGYQFTGWYTSESPSYVHGSFNDLTIVNSNMTLYAKWELN